MTLNNPNPVTEPAIEEKTFPHLWLYNILVHAPSVESGRIKIETLPYNSDTKEIGSGKNKVTIETNDLWQAVSEVPEVEQAMQSIFQAIEPLRTWIEEKQAAEQELVENPTE